MFACGILFLHNIVEVVLSVSVFDVQDSSTRAWGDSLLVRLTELLAKFAFVSSEQVAARKLGSPLVVARLADTHLLAYRVHATDVGERRTRLAIAFVGVGTVISLLVNEVRHVI